MLRFLLSAALLLGTASATAGALANAPEQVHPILLGSKLPQVMLRTLDGQPTTLKDQVAGKPAILVFYRGGWCPYCNLQLSRLRLIQKDAEALGYRILAISPDRPEELRKTLGKDKLGYTLLSDSPANALKAFGIGYRVDAKLLAQYQGYGIDLRASTGEAQPVLPVPSVFIVDGHGKLQFSYSHPDYRVRIPASVVLAAAKAIARQEQDEHP
ncbi:peroxiredoxin-like family protein [Dyella lutea]|uniref:thioredoxin-dependent peroxiredoxin n=1 Tax=Dyella lutea TaxID=2950441 RepID=A0ABT1FE92_9GAMM|nr:peroxiredoxin-like family protein [Dyella lutea]MCP1375697.1 AhpC/TSA family protein [Dyella lutea]